MLKQDIRRKIDSARDILVGKVPDPKAQVEQITTALIYKFMDDLDKESEELGGKPRFFVNEFEKYAWTKLFDTRLGGFERLNLYVEALLKMPQNKYIPQLFRDILKDAFLPYRDPETLSLFLKEINEFTYDHSENLGDAYEYLLSVLGSQGDAGQFRTPRHIIDFIVEVIDPKKDETILDPACGTAGFLISGYKHILRQNTKESLGDQLTPDEKKKLMNHFMGYDISPDMVRLSLTNMYLHSFPSPNIYEYDTLTSEERWDETYDVIMANPPFMSPKGGIRPHKRFTTQATRSEVLFVDYIAEHLNVNGRAGVIVPEGIIFQSGGAYKSLRKMLVDDNYLYAVVSLPAGIFQPYSGVKTSILLMDKSLAKKTDSILFIKINNDGFDLGAQRREKTGSDLPHALELLNLYKNSLQEGKNFEENILIPDAQFIIVEKKKFAKNGDYNLSGERYRENIIKSNQNWQMVEIGSLCNLINGRVFKPDDWENEASGGLPIIRIQNLNNPNADFNYYLGSVDEKLIINEGDLLFSWSGSKGSSFGSHIWHKGKGILNQHIFKVEHSRTVTRKFLYYMLQRAVVEVEQNLHGGVGLVHITKGDLERIKIPLPPLEYQIETVAALENYQKIIEGAKQVITEYKPQIKIGEDWELVKVHSICDLVRGSSPRPKGDPNYYGGSIPRLMISDVTRDGMYTTPTTDFLTSEGAKLSRPMKKGDVIMAVSGNPGLPTILSVDACIHDGFVGFRNLDSKVIPEFLYYLFLHYKNDNNSQSIGAVFKNLTTDQIKELELPMPSTEIQKFLIAQLAEEQKLVDANKRLIEIFEQKIQGKIAEIWGEEASNKQDDVIETLVPSLS